MSIFNKVFNKLVVEGQEASAKQMANYFGTTVGTVKLESARSELRKVLQSMQTNVLTLTIGLLRSIE